MTKLEKVIAVTKELIELVAQLDKLLAQILKVLITVGTIWAVYRGTFL